MPSKSVKLAMCKYYTTTGYPAFKPKCQKDLFASLKCHEKNEECSQYEPSETSIRQFTGIKPKKVKLL